MLAEDLGSLGGILFLCRDRAQSYSFFSSHRNGNNDILKHKCVLSILVHVEGHAQTLSGMSPVWARTLSFDETERTASPVPAWSGTESHKKIVNKNCKRPTKKVWPVLLCRSDCRSHPVSFCFRQKKNFKKHRKCLKSLTLIYKKSCHLCGHGKPGQVLSGKPKGGVRKGNQGILMSW